MSFMKIKSWFAIENFTQSQRFIIECATAGDELEIVRETEKAIFFKANSDYGHFSFWVPRACVEYATILPAESAEKPERYYDKLISWAKNNGVKGVRVGLKMVTIKKKIELAGLRVPTNI